MILTFFIVSGVSAQSLPLRRNYNVNFQSIMSIPRAVTKTAAPVKPVQAMRFSVNPKRKASSDFGFIMEDVMRKHILYRSGKKHIFIDATYNGGKNGIDGLLLKVNSRGVVTEVQVYEFKTNNAKLGKRKAGYQMSKKWILNSINKNLKYREKRLFNLEKDIKKAKAKGNSSEVQNLKNEYDKLWKERKQLERARKMIIGGAYKRYLMRLKYGNGRLSLIQEEIIGEEKNGKVKKGPEKVITDFSLLRKDMENLNGMQRDLRKNFFKAIEKQLKDGGYTENQISEYIRKIEEDASFNALDEKVQKAAQEAFEKQVKNYRIKTYAIKGTFAIMAVVSEVSTIYKYCTGVISRSELIFNTTSNIVMAGSLFIDGLTPYLTPLFICIDAVKNIYGVVNGQLSKIGATINIASNIAGLIAATAVANLVGLLDVEPITGTILRIGAFGITYGFVSWASRKFGWFIVSKYDAYKEPERFAKLYGDIRKAYAL